MARELLSAQVKLSPLFAALLIGCGGGGDGDGDGFVSWKDSVNDTRITDASGEQFQVRSSDRIVVAANGRGLSGLVVQDATVYLNGSVLGKVVYANAPGGGQMTVFECANSSSKIEITVGGESFTATCPSGGGTTNPGTNPPAGETQYDGIAASNCLIVRDGRFYNNCTARVYYSFCTTGGTSSFNCPSSPSTSGVVPSYGRGSSSIPAGGSASIDFFNQGSTTVYHFACSVGPSGRQPIPYLTSLNPTLGICR